MPKREAALKSALMQVIKQQLPGFVALRHEDVRTSGIPDLSLDGNGWSSWWEIKHATPHVSSIGIQELTCLRLAAANYCRYIIYYENKLGVAKRTLIVHPKHLHTLLPEAFTEGHNHRFVVEFMKKMHTHDATR